LKVFGFPPEGVDPAEKGVLPRAVRPIGRRADGLAGGGLADRTEAAGVGRRPGTAWLTGQSADGRGRTDRGRATRAGGRVLWGERT